MFAGMPVGAEHATCTKRALYVALYVVARFMLFSVCLGATMKELWRYLFLCGFINGFVSFGPCVHLPKLLHQRVPNWRSCFAHFCVICNNLLMLDLSGWVGQLNVPWQAYCCHWIVLPSDVPYVPRHALDASQREQGRTSDGLATKASACTQRMGAVGRCGCC